MEELIKYFEENNVDVLSIVFDANDEILHERFLKRLNENRHYVHKSEDFSNINDFRIMLNRLRRVKYPGKVISIDSTNFDYQNDEILFNEIKDFLNIN